MYIFFPLTESPSLLSGSYQIVSFHLVQHSQSCECCTSAEINELKAKTIWALFFVWISVTDFPKRWFYGLFPVHLWCTETKGLRHADCFSRKQDHWIDWNSSLQRGKCPLNGQQDCTFDIWSAHRAILSSRVWSMSLATGTKNASRSPWTENSNHGGSQRTLTTSGKLCWEPPLALDKDSWSTPGKESCR